MCGNCLFPVVGTREEQIVPELSTTRNQQCDTFCLEIVRFHMRNAQSASPEVQLGRIHSTCRQLQILVLVIMSLRSIWAHFNLPTLCDPKDYIEFTQLHYCQDLTTIYGGKIIVINERWVLWWEWRWSKNGVRSRLSSGYVSHLI